MRFGLMCFCFLLLTISKYSFADLIKVDESDGKVVYVYSESVHENLGSVIFWSLISHSDVQVEINDRYLSSKGQWEFDCTKKMSRQLFHAIYSDKMGRGETVWSGYLNSQYKPIVPGSVGASLYDTVCI